MIYSYGFSIAGSSHTEEGGICQDANKIIRAKNGWVIAAVADGVGSCRYADIAASIAVDTAVEYCEKKINKSKKCDLKAVIEEAFTEAELSVEKRAVSDGNIITEYDTTLSMVIYDGKHITYGHSGDGGIIGLTAAGDYVKITMPQKSEGIYVIPLRFGADTWIIGEAEGEFASILLATDGVYDVFFPYLLKGQPVEIYVPLIRYFMDNNILQVSKDTILEISGEREAFLNSEACAAITDDKTVVVLLNGKITPLLKDEQYYAEPDWETLQLEWDKKAYPHLYENDYTVESEIDSDV